MKKETLKKLAPLAGAVVASPLGAQVKYVDIPDTTLNTNNAFFELNIDDDTLGIIDYRFIQYVDSGDFRVSGTFIQARSSVGNSVLGLDYANYAYPFNLLPGDSIGPSQVFRGSGGSNNLGQLALEINDTTYPNDKFQGAIDGLLGLRFRAEREDTLRDFYAWVRVDLSADFKSITIKDYAWREDYGNGIIAGEGSNWVGAPELELPAAQIWQHQQTLWVDYQRAAELKLFDLQGREVQAWTLEGGKTRFDLPALPAGIYVARLEDGTVREEVKVVLY